jgi:hypothetical protein
VPAESATRRAHECGPERPCSQNASELEQVLAVVEAKGWRAGVGHAVEQAGGEDLGRDVRELVGGGPPDVRRLVAGGELASDRLGPEYTPVIGPGSMSRPVSLRTSRFCPAVMALPRSCPPKSGAGRRTVSVPPLMMEAVQSRLDGLVGPELSARCSQARGMGRSAGQLPSRPGRGRAPLAPARRPGAGSAGASLTARAALIYQHARRDREREIAATVSAKVEAALRKRSKGRLGHRSGADLARAALRSVASRCPGRL